jgi:hypothetical protein
MISIDWATKIITVPKSYTTLITMSPFEKRSLDIDQFRLDLKALEASVEGMPFDDTHIHNTTVTVGATTLARVVSIINGYTITFENGAYAVELEGANSNIADVTNLNTVQIRSNNTAGLIDANTTLSEILDVNKFLQNRRTLDETTGVLTIYEDDGVTVWMSWNIYTDDNFTNAYTKAGAEAPHSQEPV